MNDSRCTKVYCNIDSISELRSRVVAPSSFYWTTAMIFATEALNI